MVFQKIEISNILQIFVLKRHPPNFKYIHGGNMELDIFNKLNELELIKIQQWVALQNDFGTQINKLKGKTTLRSAIN